MVDGSTSTKRPRWVVVLGLAGGGLVVGTICGVAIGFVLGSPGPTVVATYQARLETRPGYLCAVGDDLWTASPTSPDGGRLPPPVNVGYDRMGAKVPKADVARWEHRTGVLEVYGHELGEPTEQAFRGGRFVTSAGEVLEVETAHDTHC